MCQACQHVQQAAGHADLAKALQIMGLPSVLGLLSLCGEPAKQDSYSNMKVMLHSSSASVDIPSLPDNMPAMPPWPVWTAGRTGLSVSTRTYAGQLLGLGLLWRLWRRRLRCWASARREALLAGQAQLTGWFATPKGLPLGGLRGSLLWLLRLRSWLLLLLLLRWRLRVRMLLLLGLGCRRLCSK